ncbi:hypothetical protein A2U01_0059113, partial [Trifolium medium]|nr:hypothetical protein [Trifolium medium]
MEISMFEGVGDACWWVLCTDKYFAAKGTPETEKLAEVATAFRGYHYYILCYY